jgi:hypothetical protein
MVRSRKGQFYSVFVLIPTCRLLFAVCFFVISCEAKQVILYAAVKRRTHVFNCCRNSDLIWQSDTVKTDKCQISSKFLH